MCACGASFAIVNFTLFKFQGLTPYEKKKYVWKMLYIYMLGYDVDFGHMEAVSLISAPKYPEKQVFIIYIFFKSYGEVNFIVLFEYILFSLLWLTYDQYYGNLS